MMMMADFAVLPLGVAIVLRKARCSAGAAGGADSEDQIQLESAKPGTGGAADEGMTTWVPHGCAPYFARTVPEAHWLSSNVGA